MKTITFIMPAVQLKPSGGYKIVYEYANRLASDGNRVLIVNPIIRSFWKSNLRAKLKAIYFLLRFKVFGSFNVDWFPLHKNVTNLLTFNLNEENIPVSDRYIATGSQTASAVASITHASAVSKYYFIQGYETWAVGLEELNKTYRMPLNKIVIADYLLEKVKELGETATLVYNGLDFNFFKKVIKIEDRDKYTIVMPYNDVKLKGCDIGFDALRLVHDRFPQLKVLLYSVHVPKNLPDYCVFYHRPNREQFNMILNNASIYLGPSYSEGFCLTLSEAMQCGCAPVCTNIGGYTVLCKDRETGLLGEVGNAESLASALIEMIENDDLRFTLANNSYAFIQNFTWERAYGDFKKALNL